MMKKISNEKLNGIVYTPKRIVNLILDNVNYTTEYNIHSKKIIDPSSGVGAFLVVVVDKFINSALKNNKTTNNIKSLLESNIYGFDIDKEAVENCRSNLNNVAKKYSILDVNWNLLCIDSLNREIVSKYFKKFDFVVGNPPYIRIQHLGKERRGKIQREWSLCQYGSTDIFIAFFELGYNLLNDRGKLGYITPNTFLKTKAGESLRYFLKESKSLKTLIDFEHYQVFDNATTYSVITILDKYNNKDIFSLYKGDLDNIKYLEDVNINNLNIDNWILTSNEILKKLKHIETRGIHLSKISDIHVGITTLADDYYIFKEPVIKADIATIRLKDGREFNIETSILKPIIKASVLKNSDDDQNRYVIFPYKKVKGEHKIMQENELKESYPLTYKYFLSIKKVLLARDKGKPNTVSWYAFGRSQGLDTSFGKKILTSGMNLKPNFIVWEREEYTFYAGYCIKFEGNLNWLAKQLNSSYMEFYINYISRKYQNNYKSFAKSFIEKFGVENIDLKFHRKQHTFVDF